MQGGGAAGPGAFFVPLLFSLACAAPLLLPTSGGESAWLVER